MQVADLILPVFAVIVTGWLAGALGYVARDLSDALIHFAYNVAMPALLIVTIAHEPARSLLAWRFLIAFGGGSLVCFAIVFASLRGLPRPGARRGGHAGMGRFDDQYRLCRASDPPSDLRAPGGVARGHRDGVCRGGHVPRGGLMQELDLRRSDGSVLAPRKLARHVILNPMVLSTLVGVAWAAAGVPMPAPVSAYLQILADALTACALFAIGLGVSIESLRVQHRPLGGARGGQARADAAHRARPFDRA